MKNYDNIQPWAPVGIANVTHGVLQHPPKILRWHGGPMTQNNYWDEWHYWTMVGIDELTGHRNVPLSGCAQPGLEQRNGTALLPSRSSLCMTWKPATSRIPPG